MAKSKRTRKAHAANRERGQRTKRAIREAAVEVALRVGPARTTLAKVAREAGVSNGAVHYHFGSIGDLFIDVLRARDVELTPPLRTLIDVGGLEGLGTLPVVGAYNAQHPKTARLHSLLMADAIDPDHFAHRWFRHRQPVMRTMLERAVTLGQERGEIREEVDAERVGATILAFMDGITLEFALDPELDILREYESFTAMLVGWLARPQPRS